MKDKRSVLAKKYLIVTLGQIIVGIGCAFLVTSGMGNDPMGVMVSGLSIKTGMPFGTVTNIVNAIIFVGLVLFYRKRLSFSTLITVVAVGWTIDPVAKLLQSIAFPEFAVKFIFPVCGCLIIGCGVAFYLSIDFGASITDNVILMIGDLTKKSYAFGCYSLYVVYFTIGLLLGGVWGYATVMTLVLNGKVIDFLIPKFEKTVAKWANA